MPGSRISAEWSWKVVGGKEERERRGLVCDWTILHKAVEK